MSMVSVPTTGYNPSSSIITEFDIIDKPLLNHNFKLVLKISSLSENDSAHSEIILPKGIELISGNLNSTISFEKGNEIKIPVILKVTKIGEYKIIGKTYTVMTKDNVGYLMGGRAGDRIYLDVSENDANISDEAPTNNWWGKYFTQSLNYENELNVDIEFGFTELPERNKEVNLLLKVKPRDNIDRARINIALYRLGISLVKVSSVTRPPVKIDFTKRTIKVFESENNHYSWTGNLIKDEEFLINLIVKVDTTGVGSISAGVESYDKSEGRNERIEISVGKYVTTINDELIVE